MNYAKKSCTIKSIIYEVILLHKVATYCRVSTSKDDQINSFERQMQMYEEEIFIHDDWELYKAYCDKGISGTDVLNRPGFLEMINAGLNSEFDILITREVSRLSRNIQQFYEFVRSLVKKGINIYERRGMQNEKEQTLLIPDIVICYDNINDTCRYCSGCTCYRQT